MVIFEEFAALDKNHLLKFDHDGDLFRIVALIPNY